MNDIRNQLEAADPLRNEPPLSDHDIQRMRRAAIAADGGDDAALSWRWRAHSPHIRSIEGRARRWLEWRWAVVTAVIAVAASAGVNRWLPMQRTPDPAAEAVIPPIAPPRQLQFVTAGGTRVIWIFNPEFETTEGSNR